MYEIDIIEKGHNSGFVAKRKLGAVNLGFGQGGNYPRSFFNPFPTPKLILV